MNAKTIAATMVMIGGMTVGTATAHANGNGRGPGNDGGCGNGQQHGCEPDNGNECSNGQHSGNPHCEPDPTVIPTVVPTVEPTVTPTQEPTPVATPIAEVQPIDPCDGPRGQIPANCFVVTTPAGPPIVVHVFTPTPTAIVESPAPVPVVVAEDFDISQVTSLPRAGDGSSSAGGNGSFLGGLLTGGSLVGLIVAARRFVW